MTATQVKVTSRKLSLLDRCILSFDQGLKVIRGPAVTGGSRPSPALGIKPVRLPSAQARHSAALMRVNHTGEVCAQALYQGQSLMARTAVLQQQMLQASKEENDHLQWCHQRVIHLKSRVSYLTPAWYVLSFAIGAGVSIMGDKWSLGFLAETESQVVQHLDKHLQRLPKADEPSRAILLQMRKDEQRHGKDAIDAGGVELPKVAKQAMKWVSKVMTRTAYFV